MNPNYKPLQQQADRLRHRVQDRIDDDSHALARQLTQASRNVMEDIESSKAPRSVESRIQQVQRVLEELKEKESSVMSARDADTLEEDYEELRREIRKLPNY